MTKRSLALGSGGRYAENPVLEELSPAKSVCLLSGIQGCYGWDFPGAPVVSLSAFTAVGPGSIPGQETKIPQAASLSQRKRKYDLL